MSYLSSTYKLSKREIEVVQEVVLGLTNSQAAKRLFVTEKTIKLHLTNVYKKMGVKSRSQLIVKTMINKNEPEIKDELPIAHV